MVALLSSAWMLLCCLLACITLHTSLDSNVSHALCLLTDHKAQPPWHAALAYSTAMHNYVCLHLYYKVLFAISHGFMWLALFWHSRSGFSLEVRGCCCAAVLHCAILEQLVVVSLHPCCERYF